MAMRLVPVILVSALLAANGSAIGAAVENPEAHVGAALYAQYCKPCHGIDRAGYAADNAPSLASSTFLETADDGFLRSAIERGRAGTAMAGYGREFGGPLVPYEIDAIMAHIRGDTRPAPVRRQASTGTAVNGERVYRAHCQSCHGTSEQRADAVHLANPMFLDTASDAFLRVAIVRGRPGTPMEAWRSKLAPKEIEDVVAYVRSLARPVAPAPASADGAADGPAIEDVPIVLNPTGPQAEFTLREGRYVSVADVAKAYDQKKRLVIVDARTTSDYLRMHITGAVSIPYFNMRDVEKVPNDGTWVITYCVCPHKVSGIVMEEFRKRGYAHSAVLDEGLFVWQQQGRPMVVAPGQLPIAAPPANPMPMRLR